MNKINIPPRLNQLLVTDNSLNSLVLNLLTIISPWASDNKTVFFCEYTDHGLKHLHEVLLTAEGLISDDSWGHLTAADSAILIIAVLLHDTALHISEDGFFALIHDRYSYNQSRYISNKETSWSILWDHFLSEAKRFDQRKLYDLFGDTEPVSSFPNNKKELTYRHRLLVGEFLRRHHARLAHEIALSGIPGTEAPVLLSDGRYNDIMDISGFIARSHNLNIRTAVDMLELTHRRVHMNGKVTFLMSVLRISDYLQIHSSRAPGGLLQLKSLVSPISRGEWRKHFAVREINQAHDDPEAIYIDCEPLNVKTFILVRNLLRDVQAELDCCWAILGEIYGRLDQLKNLGINIRRVRSNLDDPEAFSQTRKPKYIPREFTFKTASSELLDLLVKPLYGDKPTIGIRELVQNSVDACLERDDLINKRIIPSTAKENDEDVTVTILIKEGKNVLIVEDYGVGMNQDVVDNYFLNVGASFRRSDLWKEWHETSGHSTVHRTGRFGIGLLAAFLLGEEISVTTMSIFDSSDKAISFNCRQGSELIEIKPCEFHIGTKIEINLSEEVSKILLSGKISTILLSDYEEWDWYCLNYPKVTRIINSEGAINYLSQRYKVPQCKGSLKGSKWNRLNTKQYDDVLWSYDEPVIGKKVVICNGICIPVEDYEYHIFGLDISPELGIINVISPNLVIFDPDGRFPLNLQRNQVISHQTGFEDLLCNDIAEYLVEEFIAQFKKFSLGLTSENVKNSVSLNINGLVRRWLSNDMAYCVFSKKGIIPSDADLLRKEGISSILIDAINTSDERGACFSNKIFDWADYYTAVDSVKETKSSKSWFISRSITNFDNSGRSIGFFASLPIVGRRILVRNIDIEMLLYSRSIPKKQWNSLDLERYLGDWSLWSNGVVPDFDYDIKKLCFDLDKSKGFGITLLYFDKNKLSSEIYETQFSPFAKYWLQKVGGPCLHLNNQ